MQAREAAAFTADIATVRAFGVSALGGCVEASSLFAQATGALKAFVVSPKSVRQVSFWTPPSTVTCISSLGGCGSGPTLAQQRRRGLHSAVKVAGKWRHMCRGYTVKATLSSQVGCFLGRYETESPRQE